MSFDPYRPPAGKLLDPQETAPSSWSGQVLLIAVVTWCYMVIVLVFAGDHLPVVRWAGMAALAVVPPFVSGLVVGWMVPDRPYRHALVWPWFLATGPLVVGLLAKGHTGQNYFLYWTLCTALALAVQLPAVYVASRARAKYFPRRRAS